MNIAIIGAAKGLGLSLVKQLLTQGHNVAAGILMETPELLSLKEEFSNSLILFNVDITNEKMLKESAITCNNFFNNIDALCITAGVLLDSDRTNPIQECDLHSLRQTFEVNLFGPISAINAFYPYLKEQAKVLVITSEGAKLESCGSWIPAYALSKSAATKTCGIYNQSQKKLQVYAVHPGRMNTDMGRTTAQIEPEETASGLCNILQENIPTSTEHWYIDYQGIPLPL